MGLEATADPEAILTFEAHGIGSNCWLLSSHYTGDLKQDRCVSGTQLFLLCQVICGTVTYTLKLFKKQQQQPTTVS